MNTKLKAPTFLIFKFSFLSALTLVGGCGHLMHPEADEYLQQAQAPDGVQTLLNLASMMQATVEDARGGAAHESSLHKLHDQFHALHDAMCGVSEGQAAHPGYVRAVTLEKEMRTVFHRLWEYRRDDTLRDVHLDLFAARLQELRTSLESVSITARDPLHGGQA